MANQRYLRVPAVHEGPRSVGRILRPASACLVWRIAKGPVVISVAGQDNWVSTCESASSSVTSRAKLNSETNTLRAFTNMDFSPAERPLD